MKCNTCHGYWTGKIMDDFYTHRCPPQEEGEPVNPPRIFSPSSGHTTGNGTVFSFVIEDTIFDRPYLYFKATAKPKEEYLVVVGWKGNEPHRHINGEFQDVMLIIRDEVKEEIVKRLSGWCLPIYFWEIERFEGE